MRTDALVEALARDIEPTPGKPVWRRFALAALVGGLVATGVVLTLFGVRDNLGDALGSVLTKSAFCLAFVAALAPLAYVLSRPNTGAMRRAIPSMLLVAVSLAAAAIALAATAPDARATVWLAGGFPECLRRIPILATPVAVALLFVARMSSPTRLTFAGAALGGLSGAIAAIPYSWFCPVDSVAYVATWYLGAILLCAALGALLGRWILRW